MSNTLTMPSVRKANQHRNSSDADPFSDLPDEGFIKLAAAIVQLPEEVILARVLSVSERYANS